LGKTSNPRRAVLILPHHYFYCPTMIYSEDKLPTDVEKVNQIPIVGTVLEVICRSAGMGFAAVARVTKDRWIACSVLDDIDFGLEPGSELVIGTTICNEIRSHKQTVVIDHVDQDERFCKHPTPLKHGFQSYISIPIFLKGGEFFGTLCAIGLKPAKLNNPETIGMFKLFAELLSFHLNNIDFLERSNEMIRNLNRQLSDSVGENRQYKHISSHNLQEPLRKLRVFSDMLVVATETNEMARARQLSLRIRTSAQRFSMMIKDLSDFSDHKDEFAFEYLDLNQVVADVMAQLSVQIEHRNVTLEIEPLPSIRAVLSQMEQLFYQLIDNAIKFSGENRYPVIRITCQELLLHEIEDLLPEPLAMAYLEIRIWDNGVGIEASQLEKIFDIFSRLPYDNFQKGEGVGLAYCWKIVRNHRGVIKAGPNSPKGTVFTILLPLTN
jgi:signal transduction histidine kinase